MCEVAQENDILRRLKEFVAQLSHAHSDAERTQTVLYERQRLIARQDEELRFIDTIAEEAARRPRRSSAHRRRHRR